MTINPEFKTKAIKGYKGIKLIYLTLIHLLLFYYSPFVTYTSENDSQMLIIEILDYKKTILFTNQ